METKHKQGRPWKEPQTSTRMFKTDYDLIKDIAKSKSLSITDTLKIVVNHYENTQAA